MNQLPGFNMRRRVVKRAGLGDVVTDLAAFHTSVGIGDTNLAAGTYDSAVTAYQAAGQLGAGTLGPEIDTQTGGASQSTTQQAWSLNIQLQAITSSGATQVVAEQARSLATQMGVLYDNASTMQPTLPPPPTPSAPPTPVPTFPGTPVPTYAPTPAPAASTSGTDYTVPILVGAGVVGAGVIAWAVMKRK